METLNSSREKVSNEEEGLFEMFSNKFKLQYNETIKSLLFHKFVRQHDENAEEWIGRLRIAAIECNYKETDRQLMSSLYMD